MTDTYYILRIVPILFVAVGFGILIIGLITQRHTYVIVGSSLALVNANLTPVNVITEDYGFGASWLVILVVGGILYVYPKGNRIGGSKSKISVMDMMFVMITSFG